MKYLAYNYNAVCFCFTTVNLIQSTQRLNGFEKLISFVQIWLISECLPLSVSFPLCRLHCEELLLKIRRNLKFDSLFFRFTMKTENQMHYHDRYTSKNVSNCQTVSFQKKLRKYDEHLWKVSGPYIVSGNRSCYEFIRLVNIMRQSYKINLRLERINLN